MSLIPDNCNLQKRRADRKQTDRSLEKFTTISAQSGLHDSINCRNRINSVFRLKLRDLHEIRNKKKMSQSMIRSKKLAFTSDNRNNNNISEKEGSPVFNHNQRSFKQKQLDNAEILEEIKNEYKNCRVKSSKANKPDEVWFSSIVLKNSIQGIITPVVQISYNQIKNLPESTQNNPNLAFNPIMSQRSNREEVLQNANNLNKTLSRKAKSDARIVSTDRSNNKISFALIKERRNEATLNFNGGLPTNASTSYQHNLNLDEDDEIDEHYPGEDLLKDENNSINKSAQYCKRSMSEMQKSIINLSKQSVKFWVNFDIDSQTSLGKTISLSKATYIISNKLVDKKSKSNFNTKSNAIKTVSLNELSLSTKSWGLNSARQLKQNNSNDLTASPNGAWVPKSIEKPSIANISSSQNKNKTEFRYDLDSQTKITEQRVNNSSISSLKLNDQNMLIDLWNQMNNNTFYSPLARERSNTASSNNEMLLNKCKSSNSMSSFGQINQSQVKQAEINISNAPYSNIKISNRYKVDILKNKSETADANQNIEEKWGAFESSFIIASKVHNNSRVPNSIKNNIDVQKVREAILGSIDSSNSDYRSYEKRKMRFLNSLDESKDWDLFRQKYG